MLSKYHNVWFINFSGIGNGIVIAPILKCFEQSYPELNYYHTENPIIDNPWFIGRVGLKNLRGFSPITWRRFKEEDWPAINAFVKEKDIDLIINLRNEGPRYDTGYYRFKEFFKNEAPLDFWELDFQTIEQRKVHQNLTRDIIALLKVKGIDITSYDSKWLNSVREDKNHQKNFGFGMAASQHNKRWPTIKWIKLARKILANSDDRVILFPGQSKLEIEEANSVIRTIGKTRCDLVVNKSLKDIALHIGGLKSFISNDTGFLHLSSAIGVPTIGLYISTNSEIWSPYDKTNFYALQNNFFSRCPDPKSHCGNCFHYYDVCPAIKKYGDDISYEKVYEILSRLIYQVDQVIIQKEPLKGEKHG